MAMSDLFKGFHNRQQDLAKINRYKIYKAMYYRTNLVIHSQRVSWLIRELNPYALKAFGEAYDPFKAELMGLVHDDAEIVTGDIEAGIKNKMSIQELDSVNKLEENAISVLADRFPKKIGPYFYRELLQESLDHSTLESMVMQYADKFDGMGEALHEIYAGNRCFMTNVVNNYGKILLPIEHYLQYFEKFVDKFPAMRPLFDLDVEWFYSLPKVDFHAINKDSKPHTVDSINRLTGYLPYDLWIRVNLKYASSEQRDLLCEQTEFLA